MNILKRLMKRFSKNKEKDILHFIIEKLKPWIVLKYLKEENYIINDSQASILACEVLKQVIERNAQKQFIHSLRYV